MRRRPWPGIEERTRRASPRPRPTRRTPPRARRPSGPGTACGLANARARRPREARPRPRATTEARRVAGARPSSRVGSLVAHAVDGEDVARVARVRLELAAQVLDVRVDGAVEALTRLAAHGVEELRAREDAAGMPGQRGQELELRGREVDGGAFPRDAQARGVEG